MVAWIRRSCRARPAPASEPDPFAFTDEVRAFLNAELTPELRRASKCSVGVYAEQIEHDLARIRSGADPCTI